MGALLTVHETIPIDTQKQCSLLYRALLYFEGNDIEFDQNMNAASAPKGR